jgi:membrane protease YdiL (CAAX protease family)
MLLLLVIAFIAIIMERDKKIDKISLNDIKDRFRLKKMNKRDWLYTAGLFVFIILFHYLLSFTPRLLSNIPFFIPPEYVPPIANPNINNIVFQESYLGIPLKGNWWVLLIFVLIIIFNIFGEELLWRGYMLPRQERHFTDKAWLVNGLLWDVSHICWRWNMIMILPGCLAIPFVCQKVKNTYPGIIVHTLLNSLSIFPIIQGIIGIRII